MKTEDTVEYNSLRWVKKELDHILHEAQVSLSAYIEDSARQESLNECIDHLHMVQGTLQMVELYGAAQMAEEMELLAKAVLNNQVKQKDDAYDVLMRAMLQLPDYLESLQAGNKDVPMVLLPMLNDLRASRNESLLSENVMFFPDIDASDADDTTGVQEIEAGKLSAIAKKIRPHYQMGLIGWFKGEKVKPSLKRILAVLAELEKNSANHSIRRLWNCSAALVDGLMHDGLDANVSIKMILGQVDRSIKELIDNGEEAFTEKSSRELLKNLLYYVGRVTVSTPRVDKIKSLYKLSQLLPTDSELDEVRAGLGGLNEELLRTVSQAIREDLLEVKDILELFVHSEVRDLEKLKTLPDLLNKIADTMSMLGLGEPRENVSLQKKKIESIVAGELEATDTEIMEVAGVLLGVESQLNNFIASKSGAHKAAKSRHRVGNMEDMPEAEYNDVLSAVIREALHNFSDARQSILNYLDDVSKTDLLKDVLKRLDEIKGAMSMLPIQRLGPQITALENYIRKVLIGQGLEPDSETQDEIAFIITSVEYYLEALLEGRPNIELSMTAGENAAMKLEEISAKYEDADLTTGSEEEPENIVVAEPEEMLVQPVEISLEEAAVENEPEQAVTQKTAPGVKQVVESGPVSSSMQQYAILDGDADEEILEIFIEEAIEELASLNEQLPIWINNPNDEDALTTIRRSFHTLKGSGRLIGAQLIGEFAWKFESMLNRIIDNSIKPNKDVFNALEESLGVLPQLIEQLKGNQEPVENVYELMQLAEAISNGQAVEQVKVQKEEQPVEESAEEIAETAESIAIEEDQDIEIADLSEADIQLEDELDISDEFSLEDDFDVDLTDDIEALQLATSIDDETLSEIDESLLQMDSDDDFQIDFEIPEEAEEELIIEDDNLLPIHADPVLFGIFKGESESHLDQISELLEKHAKGIESLVAGNELTRALHTLFGSARTAQVEEIAELCGSAEKYVKKLIEIEGENAALDDDGVKLIDDLRKSVARMLDQLADPRNKLDADRELLERIKSLTGKVSESSESLTVEAPAVAHPVEKNSPEESLVSYSDVDDELVDIFLEEAEELLDGCENSLQKWANNPGDSDSVQELQRLLHTLKGGARMADLSPVGNLTHALESLVIAVTEGRVGFSRAMGNTLHESMDRLSDMMAKVKNREPMLTAENLINHLDALRRGEEIDLKKKDDINETELEADVDETIELDLDDAPELVFEDDEDQEEEIVIDLEPEAVATSVDLKIDEPVKSKPSGVAGEHAFVLDKDAEESVQEDSASRGIANEQVRVRSDLLNELVNHAGEVSVFHARMGQQISNFTFNLSEMDQTIVRLREQLRHLTMETEAQILSRYEKESDQYDEHFDPLEMDRFSTMQQISRSLQETVGDIESIKDIVNEDIRDAEMLLLQESRVSAELQEGLMRTRMVHFGGLASRLRRIVRQTARELDKDVELEINGESSEVDRTVLDRIVAPLEHMLRNAVAHGIEDPKHRLAIGKPEVGNIHIYVDREGGDVVMKVVDDGKGIDADAIRAKAIDRGFIEPDSKISDHDVLQFIMEAGFSTAETVTQIAGRGVGMDVVDSEIKQLGGVLEIDTIKGKGTTFTIRLPLTLAINHALLVHAGDDIYAVPLNSIKGVVRMAGPELQTIYDTEGGRYEFAGVPYVLKQLNFLLNGQQTDYSMRTELFPVLLVHVGDQRIALHVDDLLGRREVVVKPVGPQISAVRGISGATILGDGRVVLILEMNNLVLGEALFHIGGEAGDVAIEEVKEEVSPLVMVVDDSITIRKVTARMLERNGMRVVTAKDGIDAVAQLQDQIPDVMLLDIEMPRMDGYEVATHVRNDDRLKELPIIMITSRTGAKHRDKAMDIGVNRYLGKPYQEDELMENINSLLG
ncbi:MAG: Hpt domain-containing protein [Gammaproteobacteria bacterium]|nr:Hpt domain-containing protein [Gammaproteobacteria bacterium]